MIAAGHQIQAVPQKGDKMLAMKLSLSKTRPGEAVTSRERPPRLHLCRQCLEVAGLSAAAVDEGAPLVVEEVLTGVVPEAPPLLIAIALERWLNRDSSW